MGLLRLHYPAIELGGSGLGTRWGEASRNGYAQISPTKAELGAIQFERVAHYFLFEGLQRCVQLGTSRWILTDLSRHGAFSHVAASPLAPDGDCALASRLETGQGKKCGQQAIAGGC